MRLAANRCFVCGPANPVGLRLEFRIDADDVCRSEFTPGPNHAGYDQVTHGGILFAALDDVMANWMFLKGHRAYTARCEIRYRQPLALGTLVLLEGRLLRQKGKLAYLSGVMRTAATDEVVAEADGTFMVVGEIDPSALDNSPGGAL